jgi:hypothetical protein
VWKLSRTALSSITFRRCLIILSSLLTWLCTTRAVEEDALLAMFL